MLLRSRLRRLETTVTGHAGHNHLTIVLLGYPQIPHRKRDSQRLVAAVRRSGTATGPVFQLVQTDIEQLRDPPKRFVIFAGRPVEGAPGIVGYVLHLVAPFS